jgi:hypothetical protein
MFKIFTAVSLIAFLSFSCKKEKTNWNTNWSAPLIHGHLTMEDLIPQEYIETNSDNYLSIVYHEPIYSFSLDTLIDLPDTTINRKTAVNFPNITVAPGFTFIDAYEQLYDLDQIELKRVIVKSGEVEMTIRSPWPGKSKLTFDFPKILEQGSPFNETFLMAAGTTSNPSEQSSNIDMSGFDIDFTGITGLVFNTISGDITIESDEATDSYDITNSDSIEYDITFKNLIPDYAKGYFGSYSFTDTTGFAFPFMDKVLGGSIDIDSIDLTISIKNGFNLIAQSKINLLKGINSKTLTDVDLTFPLLGTSLNINPASGGLYNYTPSEYPIVVNNSNSNVTGFIENLSDSVVLGYELFVNPFGNVTAGDDELFPGSEMEIFLDAEFPVEFGANQLALTDTFEIEYKPNTAYTPENAEITLSYDNGFPLGADISLFLLDTNGVLLETIPADGPILPGTYDTGSFQTTTASGEIKFIVNSTIASSLEDATHLALIVTFTTDGGQKIKVDANAFFDFNLRSNLEISLHL